MGKVEPIKAEAVMNVFKKHRGVSDATLAGALAAQVREKLNELIAAHNEHIQTCEAGMHMRHQNQPQRIDIETITKGA